ncbi:MAG: SPOR domain-containing protein [Steroidobacteraceae bacterium]
MLKRLVIATLGLCAAADAAAQGLARLVEVVDASQADRNVNVLVQFRCSARYLSHGPTDLGSSVTVRLRLGSDCGLATGAPIPGERPSITGDTALLRSARLEEGMPGEVALTLEWSKQLNYVLAPTSDARGIRVRLLDALPGRRSQVTVSDQPEPLTGYAINVESSLAPFPKERVEEASTFLRLPAYVSTIDLEGTTWYRLRAGPIARRKDADRALQLAQQRYPRAWIGINDDASVTSATPAPVSEDVRPTVSLDPALPDAERAALLEEARKAMARKDYPRAIELLAKLTRQPEYPGRARALEMLGLARERAGHLAPAKAEYTEYLRVYPDGEAAPRLRQRLRLLASAGRRGRGGTLGGDGELLEGEWRLSGGASQMYRWENFKLDAPQAQVDRQTQNAVYTDGDFIARRRGERFDLIARVSAGYAKDLLQDGPGDQTRVSSAFVELNDRSRGIAGRLGRQSRNSGGLLGTFDGLYASWQMKPRMAISAALGSPVESTRNSPNTDRRFLGLAADFGPFKDKWDVGVFAVEQQYAGETDRRAVGVEARYFVAGRTLLGMLDYDVFYKELNSAVLMGSLQLPARWTASFNIDHRRAPVLTTRNALIGQPVASLDELLGLFSPTEIEQLARDRTPLSDIYTLSLSRPLGERLQFAVDAFATRIADTPASGGVAATPELPMEKTLQLQLIASSLWRSNDLYSFAARYQDGGLQKIASLGLATRLPIGNAWRFGPRLRIDRRESKIDAATDTLYVPALRVDYQRGGTWIELEGGAELGQRKIPAESERSQRYYFSLGYRVSV